MSKNSILSRGFSLLNFIIPFRNETDDYFVNDSCRENLRLLIVHIFYMHFLMRSFERFLNVKQDSTIFEIYLEFILYRLFHRSNCAEYVL